MTKASEADIRDAFARLVNMSAHEMAAWLETPQSQSVGQNSGDGESIGRKLGRRTLSFMLAAREPNDDDIAHMRRVVSFIRRMRTQAPSHKRETSRWRYALMNWGHDPLKPSAADSPWRD